MELFFIVWKNVYIRSIIFNHLYKYNIYYHKRIIHSSEDLKCEEAEQYRSVELHFDNGHLKSMLALLPKNVKCVEFGSIGYDEPFNVAETVPPTVTSLTFNKSSLSRPIACTIPTTLKYLQLRITNDYRLIDSLPKKGLTYLDIGVYNGIFKSVSLPNTLQTFKCISYHLSFNLNCLPVTTITNLDFGCSKINNFTTDNGDNNFSSLTNLKSLVLGQTFKEKIKIGYLPNNSLTILKLPFKFNTEDLLTKGSLPSSLTKLHFVRDKMEFGYNFNNQDYKIYKISLSKLPCSLIKLQIGFHYIGKTGITKDNHLNQFNKITFLKNTIKKSSIPKSITKLRIINQNSIASFTIPTHIQSISINGNFKFENSLELVNLKYIKINNCKFSFCFSTFIPLRTLICDNIDYIITQSDNKIPFNNSLLSLSTFKYSPEFTSSLPQSLTIFEINTSFPFDTISLPLSIHTLVIHKSTNIILPLSPTIKLIYISSQNKLLLSNLNLLVNSHLLHIIKVVDDEDLKKVFKKLSK